MGENKNTCRLSYRSLTRKVLTITCLHNETVGPSEDTRSAVDLAIIREDLRRPRMFLRWVDGKVQVADALTKLHGDSDLLRALCRQLFTVLVEAPEIMAARRQEKKECDRVPRVKSTSKLREPVIETSTVTSAPTMTGHESLFSPCHLATSSSHPVQRQV